MGGGPAFVREGLYAREAQECARLVLHRPDCNQGEARLVLGQALMWQGDMAQACVQLREALPFFDADEGRQSMIADVARRCAAETPEDPLAFGLIEEAVTLAKKRREELLDATRR